MARRRQSTGIGRMFGAVGSVFTSGAILGKTVVDAKTQQTKLGMRTVLSGAVFVGALLRLGGKATNALANLIPTRKAKERRNDNKQAKLDKKQAKLEEKRGTTSGKGKGNAKEKGYFEAPKKLEDSDSDYITGNTDSVPLPKAQEEGLALLSKLNDKSLGTNYAEQFGAEQYKQKRLDDFVNGLEYALQKSEFDTKTGRYSLLTNNLPVADLQYFKHLFLDTKGIYNEDGENYITKGFKDPSLTLTSLVQDYQTENAELCYALTTYFYGSNRKYTDID